MKQDLSFGTYIRQRRREMDLTQEELARRVGCAAITLRKIEADDLRASVQIAERLAMALAIPLDERAEFVRWARSVKPASSDLPQVTPPPSMEEIGREDLTGRAIRGYALAERIGMGGMGSVYRAVQPNVEREVAIKIILPAYANHPDFIRRFEAEAQLVARLEHPHIVPLYDYWREPGVAYLVMRLLRGGNVENLLGQGPIPIELTTRILEQICSALNSAHRIGIIHRDLKPANVLLDEDANAYLADFGIAKNLGNPDFENQTAVDVLVGSPQYMSPEQIQSLSIRPQTDIYCLGIMLYEMLTGAVPFAGPTPFEMIQQHISMPMPPLSARRAGLPAALDTVITRATAKRPEDRYADVNTLLNDFRQSIGRMTDSHPTVIAYEEETDLELGNPFKGLRAFNESDAENFFGRETLIQQLLARLGEGGDLSRFLAVVGPSGSGKSSAVRAGLVPALRRGGLPGSENWFIVDMLPGKHPFEELEASLLRVAVNPPESLLSQLKDGSRGLLRAVHRILPADESVELVLVIDQFEEIFTLVEDEDERSLLLESIANAVMDERSRLRVIITLRADFTDKPLRYVDFGEMMNRRFEFVLPLTADEVERAVAGPAQRVGLKLEKGLVSTIIREAGNQPGTLPLLQYALSELFEKREGRTLTNKAYREIGGVLGALGRSAEAIYKNLDDGTQAATRQLFLRLVTLGEGTEDTRRRVLRNELEGLSTVNGQWSTVIDRFGKARLLTFDHDPITRGATLEVAHEALLHEWSRLREWLRESRSDIRLQRQLALMVSEWQNAGRDASFLLTGTRLEQFEGWSANTSIALTQDEHTYLGASIAERNRRVSEERTRQQRELESAQKLAETERQRAEEQTRSAGQLRKRAIYLAGAFVVALAMAVVAIFFGQQAQTASRLATSRELAAASISNLDVDAERSILLALKALDSSHTTEAEDALHRAIQASRSQLVIHAHEPGAASTVAFGPDGKQLVTAASDETVKIWDATTGEQSLKLEGHFAAYSPDGKRLAIVIPDGTVKVFDVVTGKQIQVPGQVDAKLSVAFSPDGSRLVTVAYGNLPKIWDPKTGRELMSFPGHTDFVSTAVFGPDGTRILTASDDGTARIWDAKTGEQLLVLAGHQGFVWSAAYSPDGKTIATAGGNEVFIWDAATGIKLVTLAGHKNNVFSVVFSPDGTRLATGSLDRKVKIWDAMTGNELFTLSGHDGAIYGLSFSPDGARLASSSDDGTIRIWDVLPSRELLTLSMHDSSGQVAYSKDGTHLATTDENGTIKVWDAHTGKELITLPGSGTFIKDIAFNPNGTLLFSAGADSKLRIWDATTGSALKVFTAHSGVVNGLAITQDGKLLATASDDYKAKIWAISSGSIGNEPLLTLDHPGSVFSIAFNKDGSKVLTGVQDGTARIWDATTGKEILILRGHVDSVIAVAFNSDSTRVATASGDGMVKIWNASTAELLLDLHGHTNAVTFIAFSPDDKRVATVSRDGTAKLWDAVTGNELLTFDGDGSGLSDVAFSPDGKLLATGGDGGVRVYLLQIDDLIALARTRVTRELTNDECQKYLHLEQSACSPVTAAPTTTAIPATDQGRVCQVTNTGSLYDNSFNEMIYKGLQDANAMFGWDTKVLQSVSTSDYEKNFREFARGDCDLIVGFPQMADAIQSVAQTHPNQKFQIMDYVYDQPFETVRMQIFATDQAAFLAGYTAASVTRTGKVGVFGGIDIPPVTDFMDGFALGVAYYNKKNSTSVEVIGWDPAKHEGLFVGGFCCAAEGRQITQELLDQGADIILPVAGTNVGPGAAYTVKSHGNAYIIGVDTDWYVTNAEFADIVLTSIIKNYDVSVVQAVKTIVDGTFTGGIQFGTLETGEVGLASFHELDGLVSSKVKAELEQIKADIIAGKIQTKP